MLIGKKCPQCVRAFHLLVEEFMRSILQDERINSDDMLQEYSTEKSEKTRTTKRCGTVLINSLSLVFQFVRAENESDWSLH